jgi:hypothetical protein
MIDGLDYGQIEQAIDMLKSAWPGQALSDTQADVWRLALSKLHKGEFQPTLAEALKLAGTWRMDAGAFVELAVSKRPARVMPNDWRREHPDGPAPEPDQDLNHAWLNRIREENHLKSKIRKETTK